MEPRTPTRSGLTTEYGAGAFDHGLISRFNAWFFTAFARYLNHIAAHHKRHAFAGLAGRRVLEIGAGTGANLHLLPPGAELIAVEPNVQMHERLRERCSAAGVNVTVLPTGAESIPVPDGSVDEVICSLVLCTVGDPDRALAEVRRVLRPGGRFRFVEHVAAPRPGPRQAVQRLIRRPWGWLFEGCDPGRHTVAALERAGFGSVRMEQRRFRHSLFWPVNTAMCVIAVR
jgi:ubiquinone/menaquinone biosynthesis C-methylase UbiE